MPRPMRPAPRQAMAGRATVMRQNPRAAGFCSSSRSRSPRPRLGQRAAACHEILAADRAADGQKGSCQRRRDPGQFRHRNQQRQAEAQILPHVAMFRQHDPLAPVAGIGQAVVRAAAIHPLLAFAGVMMRQRKVRPAIAKTLAHRDAFGIERVGDAADRSLRAFLVDVPALEMLDRAGIHDDQRRMDDRPGIHQRRRQRIAARLDHAGKGAPDHIERMIGGIKRKYADRQPLGADGDGDFERSVLARQPGQRAGLGKARRLRDCRRRARPWQRSSSRMSPAAGTPPVHRSDAARAAVRYRAARRPGRAQDQFGVADGFGDVRCHQRQLHLVPAIGVLDDDAGAGRAMRRDLRQIAPPQPDVVALQAQNRPRPRRSRCRRRAPRSSRRLSLRWRRRVKLPQHEMLHLAQRRARQIVDKHDIARHLEAGELRQHMRFQIFRLDRDIPHAGSRRPPAPRPISDRAGRSRRIPRRRDAPAARVRLPPDRCFRRRK